MIIIMMIIIIMMMIIIIMIIIIMINNFFFSEPVLSNKIRIGLLVENWGYFFFLPLTTYFIFSLFKKK
ncbi:hypothetical protein BY996DRAFT_7096284 [Phakopsora pachyrhizi]|nr:hypothetical protein BY996DRAFT_7096284 [Phakopsora pachyrhizi]